MLKNGCALLGLVLLGCAVTAPAQAQTHVRLNSVLPKINCDYRGTQFCADRESHKNYKGYYIGHDEPALIFYSNMKGSGNSGVYLLTLPKDPPTVPTQDGSGGTWNFQLHPAFWAGMAICDSQSFPEFTTECEPDSDKNIFDSPNPNNPHFIGKHTGTAFMEMQFYPPGWIGSPQLVDPVNYFAALNIDSLNVNGATGELNNLACLEAVGEEPVNFAVITKNGIPILPPNPLGANFGNSNLDITNVLEMAPGDQILLILHDTPSGFEVIVQDLTSGESGFMVASASNGFGQVLFQPASKTCNVAPYDFHPMYATSNEHTRVPWTPHSFNTAFSDEIGHFEFCNDANVTPPFACTAAGVQDGTSVDADDTFCFGPWDPFFPGPPFQQIGGCTNAELDFDGSPYGLNWPGTFANPATDQRVHAEPITFAGPLFFGPPGLKNYQSVAFETDMADIEAINGTCDPITGAGCVLPAPGMQFYPIYTTSSAGGRCSWQLGGALIPDTTDTFGGTSTTAYGPVTSFIFQTGPTSAIPVFADFHRGLNSNPCPVSVADLEGRANAAVKHNH
jgi:hypothetical protein